MPDITIPLPLPVFVTNEPPVPEPGTQNVVISNSEPLTVDINNQVSSLTRPGTVVFKSVRITSSIPDFLFTAQIKTFEIAYKIENLLLIGPTGISDMSPAIPAGTVQTWPAGGGEILVDGLTATSSNVDLPINGVTLALLTIDPKATSLVIGLGIYAASAHDNATQSVVRVFVPISLTGQGFVERSYPFKSQNPANPGTLAQPIVGILTLVA